MPEVSANQPTPARVVDPPSGSRFGAISWFDTIDSTNRFLLDAAHSGAADGTVAVADAQTAGRGRLGRSWVAPPGASLLVSVLLRPCISVERWPSLVGAAGVAAIETVAVVADVAAQLKWPNDLVVADRKLAGLLAEADIASGVVVIGMGLNVAWHDVPAELGDIATAVSLQGGRVQPRATLLAHWLLRFEYWLTAVERDEFGRLAFAQRQRSATLGRRVRVELSDGAFVGVAHAITDNGHLVVLRDDGTLAEVAAGDVVHLRTSS